MERHDNQDPYTPDDSSQVKIADEVVGVIAGIAATEVEGVAGMAGGIASGITEVFGKRNFGKGVKVEVGDTQAALDLFLVIQYGVSIPEIAQQVQENVKRAVESMTGLDVIEVNVHVQGIAFGEPDDKEARVR
ncbi:MAG: Asp23/Gls24 family envelope stress response protein [Symbiobacteriia bacterium]